METFLGFTIAMLILIAGGSWIEYSKYKRKLTEGIFLYDTKENLQKIYHDTTIGGYIKGRVGTTYNKAIIFAFLISTLSMSLAFSTNEETQYTLIVLAGTGVVIACYAYFVKSFARKYYKEEYDIMMS